MESVFSSLFAWASSQGIGVVALLIAVWWLNKQNQAAFDTAHKEREARYELMTETMKNLTARVTACEADRGNLWAKVVDLAAKQKPDGG